MPRRAKTLTPKRRPAIPSRAPRSARFGLLQDLGPLRVFLVLFVLVVMALAPAPGTAAVFDGWEMVPTLLAPVLAPILLQVLLLDALMSRVLMSAQLGAERARFRRILWVNLAMAGLSVLWWLPYFISVVR